MVLIFYHSFIQEGIRTRKEPPKEQVKTMKTAKRQSKAGISDEKKEKIFPQNTSYVERYKNL